MTNDERRQMMDEGRALVSSLNVKTLERSNVLNVLTCYMEVVWQR